MDSSTDALSNLHKHFVAMSQLYERWLDEKGYESFGDYRKAILKHFETNEFFPVVKVTQRPFAVHFQISTTSILVMKFTGKNDRIQGETNILEV
jgi:hypothetical protein